MWFKLLIVCLVNKKDRVFTRCHMWCLNIRYPMYLLEFKNMIMQDCFRMSYTMSWLLMMCTCWSSRTCASRIVSECHIQCHGFWYWLYLLELKRHVHAGLFQDVVHNVMASDIMYLLEIINGIMQNCSRMSDPMSWHPVHRTFSVNVWCFVIAQLMAIYVWLKIWFAGAFNH